MTKLLEQAFKHVRTLPADQQDEFARVLLNLAGDDDAEPAYRLTTEEATSYRLTTEEATSLAKSREQAARREFAADEDVRAVWAKHGL